MTSGLRVGILPYLNSEPFFAYLEGVAQVPMMPRALGACMRRGELDAGLLSLADALALGDAVHRLPFGIATQGATGSVHVWSHRPLEALHGATVGVTDQTSTSVQILKLLLERRYGVKDVRWTEVGGTEDAVLLIGDDALTRGLAHLDAIAARRRDTGISDAEVVSYLANFIYRFGPGEARAVEEFIRLSSA